MVYINKGRHLVGQYQIDFGQIKVPKTEFLKDKLSKVLNSYQLDEL